MDGRYGLGDVSFGYNEKAICTKTIVQFLFKTPPGKYKVITECKLSVIIHIGDVDVIELMIM